MQTANSFDKETVKKILKSVGWSALTAGIAYLLKVIPEIKETQDLGVWGYVIAGCLTVVLNASAEYKKGE